MKKIILGVGLALLTAFEGSATAVVMKYTEEEGGREGLRFRGHTSSHGGYGLLKPQDSGSKEVVEKPAVQGYVVGDELLEDAVFKVLGKKWEAFKAGDYAVMSRYLQKGRYTPEAQYLLGKTYENALGFRSCHLKDAVMWYTVVLANPSTSPILERKAEVALKRVQKAALQESFHRAKPYRR